MKTEDELLALIAKMYVAGDIGYIKGYLAENIIYDSHGHGILLPVMGKEKVCAKIKLWFRDGGWGGTIWHTATDENMGHVILANDKGWIFSYVIIESDGGLIIKYYDVSPGETDRRTFQILKQKYFGSCVRSISAN